MKKNLIRKDDYEIRRREISSLSNEELKQRFWQLSEKIVDPMLNLAKKYTTPSIERSVVLRMGFSSLEAAPLVKEAIERQLVGKGVGHLIFRVARDKKIPIRKAGLEMIDGEHWDYLEEVFTKRK